jgi:uncharacterized membrane protein
MKSKLSLLVFSVLLVHLLSCNVEKRLYTSGYHFSGKNFSSHKINIEKSPASIIEKNAEEYSSSNYDDTEALNDHQKDGNAKPIILKKQKAQILFNPVQVCDTIVFHSGERITAQVLEITSAEIRYRKCANLDGPTYIVERKDVFSINYANGTKDVISPVKPRETATKERPSSEHRRNEPLGLTGFIISIVGLLVPIVSVIGLVFGIISLSRIARNTDIYRGKGFGISAIIISLLTIILTILFIIILMAGA